MEKTCKVIGRGAGKTASAARLGAAVCAALVFASGASVVRAAPFEPPPGAEAGTQLNQTREAMERQRVAQQMEEDQKKKKEHFMIKIPVIIS